MYPMISSLENILHDMLVKNDKHQFVENLILRRMLTVLRCNFQKRLGKTPLKFDKPKNATETFVKYTFFSKILDLALK